jgi:hypothetical protein
MPLINSAIGQRIVAEHNTNIMQTITGNSRLVLTAAATPNAHSTLVLSNNSAGSALVLRNNSAGADNALLPTTEGMNDVHGPNATLTNVMGQISAGTDDKLVTVPKKRLRTDQNLQAVDSEVEQGIGLESEDMQVDKYNEGLRAADNSVTMQSNPLFVDKIVMAGSGNQTRQHK